MNVVLWIIAIGLSVVFALAGLVQLFFSKEQLVTAGLGSTEAFSAATVKVVGVLELVAAIGLVLPPVLDTLPAVVPLAAAGLVLLMGCAGVVHARRGEFGLILVNATLLVLAVIVAVGRFGRYAF